METNETDNGCSKNGKKHFAAFKIWNNINTIKNRNRLFISQNMPFRDNNMCIKGTCSMCKYV